MSKFKDFWVYLGLLGLTCLIYANSLNSAFQFDDYPTLLDKNNLKDFWVYAKLMFSGFFIPDRSFVNWTFAINYAIHGYSLFGFHLTNTLWHAHNGVLCYFVLKRLLQAYTHQQKDQSDTANLFLNGGILWVTFVFVCHPLLTASVTYITQRNGLAAYSFTLIALLCYLKIRSLFDVENVSVDKAKILLSKSFLSLAGIFCLSFWLGIHSKEVVATLPLWLLTYEFILAISLGRVSLKMVLVLTGLSLSCVALLLLFITTEARFTNNYFIGFSADAIWGPWLQMLSKARAVWDYWRLLFMPWPGWLNIDHDFTVTSSAFEFKGNLALLAHVFVITSAFLQLWWIHSPKRFAVIGQILSLPVTLSVQAWRLSSFLIALGVCWFYLPLAPYFIVPERDILVEYKTYLSTLGFLLMILGVLNLILQYFNQSLSRSFFSARLRFGFCALAILLIFTLSWGTFERNKAYQSTLSLWQDSSSKQPDKDRALHNVGFAYTELGALDLAQLYFYKTLQVNPNFSLAFLNLGRLYALKNDFKRALFYLESLEQKMQPYEKKNIGEISGQLHAELGNIYETLGQNDAAVKHFEKTLALESGNVRALSSLGKIKINQQKRDEGYQYLKRALAIDPHEPLALSHLGAYYLSLNQPQNAYPYLIQAAQFKTADPFVWSNFGVASAMLGMPEQACRYLNFALQLNEGNKEAKFNLEILQKGYPRCQRSHQQMPVPQIAPLPTVK